MMYRHSRELQTFPHRGRVVVWALGLAALLALSSDAAWARDPTVTIRTLPSKGDSPSQARPREEKPAPRRRRTRRKPRPIAPPASTVTATEAATPRVTRRERKEVREEPTSAVRRARPESRPQVRASKETPKVTGNSAVELNAQGFRLFRRGRYAEAEPYLRRAVELKPNFPYALYNLGTALLEQGKFRDAVGPLEKTAAMQPTRWEPQERLAETYAALGNLKRSRAAAERARDLRSRRSARN